MSDKPTIGMQFDGGVQLVQLLQNKGRDASPKAAKALRDTSDFLLADVQLRAQQLPPGSILAAQVGLELPVGSPTTPAEYADTIYQEQVGPNEWLVKTDQLFAERLEFGYIGDNVIVQPEPIWRPADLDAEKYLDGKMKGVTSDLAKP